ncbi:MAG: malate dehydrogenase NAD-dependent [Candidatus Scalindua rubra]|uniref:Malate dehydrogenase NAD-dependent n=1 Tax=Candidatus Scalindua rubra TaxID=1872076 RepID=A0A1E3X7V3_9BACT|nr:MAG: malate dehydrogenase NAD-dependent [Candidatus Scalindua rubra]
MLSGKISVVGTGNVGQSAIMNLFEKRVGRSIYCFNVPGEAINYVKARIDEIKDSHEQLGPDLIESNNPKEIEESEIVVITSGRPRVAEQTRDDLAIGNACIIAEWAGYIKKYAPEAVLVVVSNPVAAMTGVALEKTGFPRHRVLGMGSSLDAKRVIRELAKTLGLTSTHMQGYVLGDHGESMIIPIRSFTVYGQSLRSYLESSKSDKLEEIEKIAENMKTASQYLIEGLRTSPWLGPGEHIASLCEHIYYGPQDHLLGTVTNAIVKLEGEYGVNGVIGVPVKIGRRGMIEVIELDNIGEENKEKLRQIAEHIKKVTKIALDALDIKDEK